MKTWSNAKLKSFLVGVLRAGFRRWPAKYEALKDACVGKKTNIRTQRQAKHYTCNVCKGDFPATEIQVDHISPVVDPNSGFVDWDTFIDRLFCDKENLQAICKTCHKEKTQEERAIARNTKSSKK